MGEKPKETGNTGEGSMTPAGQNSFYA